MATSGAACGMALGGIQQPRYRWAMLALVWQVYICYGIATASLAPLVRSLTSELSITSSQMGAVLGSWQLVYILAASPTGHLMDKWGPRRTIGIGVAFIALSLGLRALAVDFYSLLAAVALFGLGGPSLSVGCPKALGQWFRGRQRSIAVSFCIVSPFLGATVVLSLTNSLLVPWLGDWRPVFLLLGAVPAFATVVWWTLARDRAEAGYKPAVAGHGPQPEGPDKDSAGSIPRQAPPTSLRLLLKLWHIRLILLLAFAYFLMNHGLNNWLPSVLMEKGMDPAQAGFWAAVPSFAGIFGQLLIPSLVGKEHRALSIALLLALAALSTLGIAFADVGTSLAVALAISGIARHPLLPSLVLMLMETPGVGQRSMGTAAGLMFAGGQIGGFLGPILLGLIFDIWGAFLPGLMLLAGVGLIGSFPALVAQRGGFRGKASGSVEAV